MVGFGFSVGDFIAGINTLIDIVHSLSDTNGAQADYKELGSELQSLKSGLDGVKALPTDPTQTTEFSALHAAVENCRACVERFVRRNSKFKSLENIPGKKWSLATLKECGRKVQWAIWKKNDVENFRGRVQWHTGAIGMLLATIQAKNADAAPNALTKTISTQITKAFSTQQNSLKKIGRNSQNIVDKQKILTQSMSIHHTKVRDLLCSQARDQERAFASQESIVAQTGIELQNIKAQIETMMTFQNSVVTGSSPLQEHLLQNVIQYQQQLLTKLQDIYDVNRLGREIPAQVLLSKPVILLDARGRVCPFFLETINSADAFVDFLKLLFRDRGIRKIEKGQFVLEDKRRKFRISLKSPWATAVRPGQHISMSMVFRQQQNFTGICPSCGEKTEESKVEEVDCVCGMTYRRIVEGSHQTTVKPSSGEETNSRPSGDLTGDSPSSCGMSNHDDSMDEEMHHYTRVQILIQSLLDPRQGPADSSIDSADDEMSAAMIGLDFCDDLSPIIDLEPTGDGKSKMSKASPKINEDTLSTELLNMSMIDLKPTGVEKSEMSKASPRINEDALSALLFNMSIAGKSRVSKAGAKTNEDTLSVELSNMSITDLKPTGVGKSEMSKASAKINKDTLSAEPLDMSTKFKFPAPEPPGPTGWYRGNVAIVPTTPAAIAVVVDNGAHLYKGIEWPCKAKQETQEGQQDR